MQVDESALTGEAWMRVAHVGSETLYGEIARPVVLTFFLGVGVYRLARRQALVRRAVVVENIGRVTCICSDKTGTIPEGRLRLSHRVPAGAEDAEFLLQLAAAASRSESGDPMDVAILDALPQPLPWETVATFPFTEDRKRETGVLRRDGQVSWMPCRRAALRASASSRSPGIMRGRRLPSRARSGSAAARSSRSPATE